ncbi:ComEC/Rec2 family competence protein [Cellulomonas sp. Y8]|uniref:ComEC/Rec2 family competence protein n=1 Tax=Cellulomonas sp. Y8 TaxID=2591145 RepID=UPI0011C7F5D1|nr:ComEC/Rec2 family competence protein [Cellulomonas sp. Y8]
MSADEAVDVRLVPAASAVWGAAAVVVGGSPGTLAAGAAVVGLAAVGALAGSARRAPAPRPQRIPVRLAGRAQAGLALGAVAVLLLTTALQVLLREAGDVRGLAEERVRVRIVGTVRTTPQAPGGAGGTRVVRFLLAATSVEVLGAGGSVAGVAGGAAHGAGAGRPTGAAVEVYAPAAAAHLAYGTEVVVEGRLSPVPDGSRRAVARARTDADPTVRAPPPAVLRAADRLRTGLVTTAAGVPGDAGRLLPAVAVGDTRGVGDLDEAMRVSGLAHITAVSGAHFSILGAVVRAVLTRGGVPRRWRWLPLAVVLGGFVAVVQPGASVVRAAVMGAVGILGLVAGRPSRSVPALAAAVLVLLVADPWLARDVGFVLSVVATAGIALLAGPLARRWSGPRDGARGRSASGRRPRPGDDPRPAAGPVATALAVPVAAQAACAPVLLVLTPAVPVYSVLANVAAAPAVAPATVGGLVAAVVGPWWPAAAACCAQVAGAACWWIAAVARTTAGLPGAQVAWVAGPPGQVLLACACGAALVLVLRCRRAVAP